MPPRPTAAAAGGLFNLTSLFQALPRLTYTPQPQFLPTRSICPSCAAPFSTTAPLEMKRKRKVRKRIDPYRQAQARQRRAANVARQESLRKAGLDLGHPVHSRPTPFIESLHPNAPLAELKTSYLNYFVKPNELSSSIERSAALTKPREIDGDDSANADRLEIFEAQHENAINVLAANLGGQDKINKRNLRLLVHKRQKHLNYLRKQDRGGPRWRNLVEKLGVNDGMWRGEISL
ncbi:uncharacterized protein AB675_2098 [Cyphellophora attinorum]|uniref:37S ribosomal protein S28, mitochondrial n=1 Tax=Cyphellophora attinorum TaxID=1664694 RepID=A0A0N1H868_9EURO|nr:uncharacterized protein AB675_2098 [Phialophora attinorum]KPI42970.1 hypothetical protein AB675_2098 [Phialophora attinorum]